MKLFLIIVIAWWTLSATGQTETIHKKEENILLNTSISNKEAVNDTIPVVEYSKTESSGLQPAYYINGEPVKKIILKTIDLKLIDSIHVEKKEIEIDGNKYYGQIFLEMKKDYNPKLISLTDLKLKYLQPTNKPAIFIINDEVVRGDYDEYLVDEKYILKIVVDQVENEDELNIEVVRLLTKTEGNIKKSQEIKLRGVEEMTIN